MPNMIERKSGHGLVVVRNKLFVIGSGNGSCEVFDNKCGKFVVLKSTKLFLDNLNTIIPIGDSFFVFCDDSKSVLCYDVNKNEWSTKYLQYDIVDFSCVKVPCV